jgi:DNA-binding transcriptional LysR family regulator
MTASRYAEAHHITVSPRGKRDGPIDLALAEQRLTRRHITTVTSFVVAAHLVAATDLVGSLPQSIVALMSRTLPITALQIPVCIPDFEVSLIWHDRDEHDPGHQWLRHQILESFGELGLSVGVRAEMPATI